MNSMKGGGISKKHNEKAKFWNCKLNKKEMINQTCIKIYVLTKFLMSKGTMNMLSRYKRRVTVCKHKNDHSFVYNYDIDKEKSLSIVHATVLQIFL